MSLKERAAFYAGKFKQKGLNAYHLRVIYRERGISLKKLRVEKQLPP